MLVSAALPLVGNGDGDIRQSLTPELIVSRSTWGHGKVYASKFHTSTAYILLHNFPARCDSRCGAKVGSVLSRHSSLKTNLDLDL